MRKIACQMTNVCGLWRARASASCAQFAWIQPKSTWWGHCALLPPNRDFCLQELNCRHFCKSATECPLGFEGGNTKGVVPQTVKDRDWRIAGFLK
jgi:hypothetical protein